MEDADRANEAQILDKSQKTQMEQTRHKLQTSYRVYRRSRQQKDSRQVTEYPNKANDLDIGTVDGANKADNKTDKNLSRLK